ncbi:Anaphase-promoting complex subunit 7 [Boothiomyces sp. JEL0866]|nr:Anaphase-promoting complex subunit 7 [Boothiomyces sp. JEL0866]
MQKQILEKAIELFKQGLYGSSQTLAELLVNERHAQSLILYADCLVKSKQYQRSLKYYQQALNLKKNSLQEEWLQQALNRFIDACIMSKEYYIAKEWLEKTKVRSIRTMNQLAKVYEYFGEIKSAIDCYKEILKTQPYAIEAIKALLVHGLSLKELQPILIDDPFIHDFSTGLHAAQNCNYTVGLSKFQEMEREYRSSTFLSLQVANVYSKSGDPHAAIQIHRNVLKLDPACIDGLNKDALEMNEERPEVWIIRAINSLSKEELDIALEQADKAVAVAPTHMLGHVLKGKILMETSKFGEAAQSFRNAYRLERDLSNYEGLTKCYSKLGKHLEATTTAKEAFSLLPNSPKAVTLAGLVLAENPTLYNKAKDYLEKAIKMNSKLIEPLFGLADLYEKHNHIQKAIELLENHSHHHHHYKIHLKLGHLYCHLQEWSKATLNFHTALNIFPDCAAAKRGLAEIEKTINGNEEGEDLEEEDVDIQSIDEE